MTLTNLTSRRPQLLLVVEDDVDTADLVAGIAQSLGCEVNCVHDGSVVASEVRKLAPDLIALDLGLPGADGVEILRKLARNGCTAKIILMSGMGSQMLATVQAMGKALNLEIVDTLKKPMSLVDIQNAFSPYCPKPTANEAGRPGVKKVPPLPSRH